MFNFFKNWIRKGFCVYHETCAQIDEYGTCYSSFYSNCGLSQDLKNMEYLGKFCENCGQRILTLKTKNIKDSEICVWENIIISEPNFIYSGRHGRVGKVIHDEFSTVEDLMKIKHCYCCGKKVKLIINKW